MPQLKASEISADVKTTDWRTNPEIWWLTSGDDPDERTARQILSDKLAASHERLKHLNLPIEETPHLPILNEDDRNL